MRNHKDGTTKFALPNLKRNSFFKTLCTRVTRVDILINYRCFEYYVVTCV